MITRRLLLKWFASILALCLTPWRECSPGLRDTAPEVCTPATSLYEDVIVIDQHRGRDGRCGVKINGNQVFYPGCRKVVFNNKDYGVVAINSRPDPFREKYEDLLFKKLVKGV